MDSLCVLTNSFAVGFHGHGEVFEFQVLMSEKDPRTLVAEVRLDGHLKVSDSLFMFTSQTVEVGLGEGRGGRGGEGGEGENSKHKSGQDAEVQYALCLNQPPQNLYSSMNSYV